MQKTIVSPVSLGMVRIRLLEFFENKGYKLTSLDPNSLHFERSSTMPAAASVKLAGRDEETRLQLHWHLTPSFRAAGGDTHNPLQEELAELLADIEGRVAEDPQSSPVTLQSMMQNEKIQELILSGVESRFRFGANWFFWIAGLSVINSVLLRIGGNLNFIFGLGLTQVIDAVDWMIVEQGLIADTVGVHLLSMTIILLISGLFAAFGLFSRKKHKWAFLAGMAIYLIDGLILVLFQDYLSAGVHLYVLFGLYQGYKALLQLLRIEKNSDSPE